MSSPLRPLASPARRIATALYLASFGLLTICIAVPARAAAKDEATPDYLAQLEQRASEASPREQCFLYAQLVHEMTEQAGKQIGSGDTEQAAATLKKVNRYAHLIHINLARDTKQLKNAEM